ncbi:MAG TPA: hypothetical protein VKA27_14440 [Sunxiuqinia sp.]|nr:hypothetical protein [Sunxiuqinia sp.]
MKELSFEKMERLQGGDNLDNAVCTISTVAWALGTLTVETGFGLILWGIGGAAAVYCNYKMVS